MTSGRGTRTGARFSRAILMALAAFAVALWAGVATAAPVAPAAPKPTGSPQPAATNFTASISGPGISGTETFNKAKNPTQYNQLVSMVSWMDNLPGNIIATTPPDLGPDYTIKLLNKGQVVGLYDLYPLCPGGARSYRSDSGTGGTWFYAPRNLVDTLTALGVPVAAATLPSGAVTPRIASTEATVSFGDVLRQSRTALLLAGGAAAFVLIVLGLAARRSRRVERRRTAPAAVSRLPAVTARRAPATGSGGPTARLRPGAMTAGAAPHSAVPGQADRAGTPGRPTSLLHGGAGVPGATAYGRPGTADGADAGWDSAARASGYADGQVGTVYGHHASGYPPADGAGEYGFASAGTFGAGTEAPGSWSPGAGTPGAGLPRAQRPVPPLPAGPGPATVWAEAASAPPISPGPATTWAGTTSVPPTDPGPVTAWPEATSTPPAGPGPATSWAETASTPPTSPEPATTWAETASALPASSAPSSAEAETASASAWFTSGTGGHATPPDLFDAGSAPAERAEVAEVATSEGLDVDYMPVRRVFPVPPGIVANPDTAVRGSAQVPGQGAAERATDVTAEDAGSAGTESGGTEPEGHRVVTMARVPIARTEADPLPLDEPAAALDAPETLTDESELVFDVTAVEVDADDDEPRTILDMTPVALDEPETLLDMLPVDLDASEPAGSDSTVVRDEPRSPAGFDEPVQADDHPVAESDEPDTILGVVPADLDEPDPADDEPQTVINASLDDPDAGLDGPPETQDTPLASLDVATSPLDAPLAALDALLAESPSSAWRTLDAPLATLDVERVPVMPVPPPWETRATGGTDAEFGDADPGEPGGSDTPPATTTEADDAAGRTPDVLEVADDERSEPDANS